MTHLLKVDADLMQEFLDANPNRYTVLEFDVHVGKGRDPGATYNNSMRTMAVGLSQRRIDAVGFLPGRIEIIEVTQTADLKALGQLLAYPALFKAAFNPEVPLAPILVARQFGTDTEDIWAQSNVETHIFPA